MRTEVPPGWAAANLAEVCSKIVDGSHTPPPAKADGLPMLSGRNILDGRVEFSEYRLIDPAAFETEDRRTEVAAGDVLLTIVGSIGRAAVVPEGTPRFTLQRSVAVLRTVGLNPYFCMYQLQAPRIQKWLTEQARGTAQKGVYLRTLGSLQLHIAPVGEQVRIVGEIEKQFTRLDAAVAALKRVQGNLKRYRASVLKAACEGRLVPTEAELARREGRPYEPASELLQRILQERRAKWEADQLARMTAAGKPPRDDSWKRKYKEPEPPGTSCLPELPEGWAWATWEQVGFSQNGRPFPSKQYGSEGVKLLRPGNLHASGRVEWNAENTRRLSFEWENENQDLVVGPGELVVNLTAQSLKDEFLGRVCITGAEEHCLLNQRLARLSPVLMSPRYLLWMFKSSIFRRFVDGLNTGSLIQHMFTSQIARFALPLPPLREQGRIVQEVERRLSTIEQLETTCETKVALASSLRQAILKRAFEGQLVPQDPNDEPASVLLERIRAERAQHSARGRKVARRGRAAVAAETSA